MPTRRQFLRGGVSASAVALSACRSLDRIVLGEYREDAERVTIIGAGLAGLMAAYELKRRQIPFQVYEASGRIGGRLYTVPDFAKDQSMCELGAEWFDSSQKLVFQMAQELRVDILEGQDMTHNLKFVADDRLRLIGALHADFSRLQKIAVKEHSGTELSEQSLQAWINIHSADQTVRDLVQEWSFERYGTAASELAAARFVNGLRAGSSPLANWTDQRFRFRNGASNFTRAFYDRVAGFEPEKTFVLSHRLKGIRLRPRGYELYFETPQGEVSFVTRAVICTIPAAALKEVEGITELPAPWEHPEEFKMGGHGKVLFLYDQRFWLPTLDRNRISPFQPQQSLWEASVRESPVVPFKQGVLAWQVGGSKAADLGPQSLAVVKSELAKFFKSEAANSPVDEVLFNWPLSRNFGGSVSYPSVKQKAGVWRSHGFWQWAGEHTSGSWRGTMQGALLSAQAAVEQMVFARQLQVQ